MEVFEVPTSLGESDGRVPDPDGGFDGPIVDGNMLTKVLGVSDFRKFVGK
jgi:hypothetical protein